VLLVTSKSNGDEAFKRCFSLNINGDKAFNAEKKIRAMKQ
jgi:hypothetical protein